MAISVKIAVASDLHCAGEKHKAESLLPPGLPRDPSCNHPVQSLLELIAEKELQADVLMVPGDVTNRADMDGLQRGCGFLDEIGRALGAELVGTLGNHDVDWGKGYSPDPLKLPQCAHPDLFPIPDKDLCRAYWSDRFSVKETQHLVIVTINSVAHYDENAAKRGVVDETLLGKLTQKLDNLLPTGIRIALCHHHPIQHEGIGVAPNEVMTNGSLLAEALREHSFCLLVHGHKHYPRLSTYGDGKQIHVLASGSFGALFSDRGLAIKVRNLFHIVDLHSPDDTPENARGTITSWQFNGGERPWREADISSTRFPWKTGFGAQRACQDIAGAIARWFPSCGKVFVTWDAVVSEVPEVAHLTPDEFAEVAARLANEYDLTTQPPAPDVPTLFGELSA